MRSNRWTSTQMRALAILAMVLAAGTFCSDALAQMGYNRGAAPYVPQNDVPETSIQQKLDAQVPLDLTFTDSSGRKVTLAQYLNGERPVLLTLVYYKCPMLCGVVLESVLDSIRGLPFQIGKDYDIVTVSFNPKETPALAGAKKQAYIKEYGRPEAAKGWHFLTGDEQNIKALADAVGFGYRYVPETGEYAHSAGVMVLTPEGRVSRYLLGIEYPTRDLRFALMDASQNKIGSAVEQILLLCYQYDPATGGYTFLVHRLLQVFGVATVIVLVLLIVLLTVMTRRRDRRRAEALEAQGVMPSAQANETGS